MNTIELFSGTKSFSKVAKELGHDIFTIDNDENLKPDLCIDIMNINKFYSPHYDILWASPPCTTFSVASIGKHWTGGKTRYIPKTKECEIGIMLLDKTIKIISDLKPTIWFIENPRGVMRKIIDNIFYKYNITEYRRVTITYCQYGDKRMKPTDIWTNCKTWKERPICKNGDKCHISAPRGARTGTQGIKGSKDRGAIPEQLFYDIFKDVIKC